MVIFIFLIVLLICITLCYLIYKFSLIYEYKHCLNCPLKKACDDIEFDCFAEDIKKEREVYFQNEKEL